MDATDVCESEVIARCYYGKVESGSLKRLVVPN